LRPSQDSSDNLVVVVVHIQKQISEKYQTFFVEGQLEVSSVRIVLHVHKNIPISPGVESQCSVFVTVINTALVSLTIHKLQRVIFHSQCLCEVLDITYIKIIDIREKLLFYTKTRSMVTAFHLY